jgi:3-methylcrotonyl-CoA carboxylase alpha subunit
MAVHVLDRECSLQRRHQKVVEEAPAPSLPDDLRESLRRSAVTLALAAGYEGAGTVEFLLGDGGYFFLEMNARLQVEHPVTELVTGLDLVEWQLRLAAGEELPAELGRIAPSGHAIEARLYAEDPSRGFAPSAGRLAYLRLPRERDGLRVDAGVREGDVVTLHYDPLLAKIAAWGVDRPAALRRLREGLRECRVAGPATNVALLAGLAGHPAVAAAAVDTGFLERNRDDIVPPAGPAPERAMALAALAIVLRRERRARDAARATADPWSPWSSTSGWRAGGAAPQEVALRAGECETTIRVWASGAERLLEVGGARLRALGRLEGPADLVAEIDGERVRATVVEVEDDLTVLWDGGLAHLRLVDADRAKIGSEAVTGSLSAPMPGRVAAVRVTVGDVVERGAPLVVLEAMKMELTVAAPAAGRVSEVRCKPGDQVAEGTMLLVIEDA